MTSTIAPTKSSATVPANRVSWSVLLFICLISLIISGHRMYEANQAVEIPYARFLRNPSLYPNDPMVATVRHHTTLFWRGIALATNVLPIGMVLQPLYVLERLLVIYAVGRIARSLAPGSQLTQIGAMLVAAFMPSPLQGNGTTLPDYVEQTGVAVGILLLAIAFLLERKYGAWAICTGIAVNLNVLYAGYSMTYAAAILLAERRPFKDYLLASASGVLTLLFALPVLIAAYHEPRQELLDKALWVREMLSRSAIHLAPWTWPKMDYVKYAALVAAMLVSCFLVRRRKSELSRIGLFTTGVNLFWFCLAILIAYHMHARLPFQIQAIRGTDLWYFFAGIVLVCLFTALLARILGEGFLAKLFLCVPFMLIAWWPSHQHQGLALFLVTFISLGLYLIGDETRTRRNRQITRSVALVMALGVVGVGMAKQWKASQPPRPFRFVLPATEYEIYRAARFAVEHTPIDAVFVVDPMDRAMEPFRGLAYRPVFVEYKDGTAFFYDLNYVIVWCERMTAAGCNNAVNFPATAAPYPAWRDADIAKLAVKYRVDYWIVPLSQPTSLKSVWTGKYWKILRIKSA